jgi:single-strand DNA-binding protein
MLPLVSGEFRVVADPTLRFAPSGMAVTNMRVVADKKKKNEATGEWEDDKVCWLSVVAFKKLAENIAESCEKGSLVLITGRLQTETYEKDGEKKQSYTIVADTIGPSLAWNAAKVIKTDRAAAAPAAEGGAPAVDPWATPPQGDDPPF